MDRCLSFCSFPFGNCVVCFSSIYGLWLPLWYYQIILNVHLCYTSSVFRCNEPDDTRDMISIICRVMCMLCRSLCPFVPVLVAILLFVLRFTDSDYLFGIFKLFLLYYVTLWSRQVLSSPVIISNCYINTYCNIFVGILWIWYLKMLS